MEAPTISENVNMNWYKACKMLRTDAGLLTEAIKLKEEEAKAFLGPVSFPEQNELWRALLNRVCKFLMLKPEDFMHKDIEKDNLFSAETIEYLRKTHRL